MAQQSLAPFFGNRFMSRRPQDADPLLALRRDLNRLFEDVFSGLGLPLLAGPLAGGLAAVILTPQIDVSETDQEFRVTAELPGIDEKDVEVTLTDDVLMIRGKQKAGREEEKDRGYHLRERVQGTFSRVLRLPFAADPNQVQATFKNGILTITIAKPKEVQEKTHRIEVKGEEAATGEPSATGAQASETVAGQAAE